jgi:predicted SAM-dependent methyltransferase
MVVAKKVKVPKEVKPVTLEIARQNYAEIVGQKLKQKDNSVDELGVINTIEYLKPEERILFINELHRILKSGGKAMIVTPYWASSKAYGDLNFQWPPVVESWYFSLNREWREKNNPDERYTCDFDHTWGYGMHQLIQSRNQEYQQHAIIFWKEAAQDLMATLIKR